MKIRQYDLRQIRSTDFTKFIDTPIREVAGKRQLLCPFHQEKTPSFFIFPDNSFHCFACGVHGGGAIDFMMKLFGCSFKEACERLERI